MTNTFDKTNGCKNGEIIVRKDVLETTPPEAVELPDIDIPQTSIQVNSIDINNDDEDDDSDSSRVGSEHWQTNSYINPEMLLRMESMMSMGNTPSQIFRTMFPDVNINVEKLSDKIIIGLLMDLMELPPSREKLPNYNSFDDAVELFRSRRKILILTGAGVSVSCGIPDFRSKNGIYARLHVDFPDLPNPTAMFDIRYFKQRPEPFYNFAKEIFPGQFKPSIAHRFIKTLEENDQLLRNYTQNIDTLEYQTGIKRVIECHGSFSKATCTKCGMKYNGDIIKEDVMAQRVARCITCIDGVIKPDIVFFGEDLAQDFHRQIAEDKNDVDLVVVIGSSLNVRPVSLIPFSVDRNVPQILINRESLKNYRADIELLGNCDDILREIALRLGGNFEKMIRTYDNNGSDCETSTSQRKFINIDKFHQIMDNCSKPSESMMDDEPECKRVRKEMEPSTSEIASMYEMRYVNIERNLPSNSFAQISMNQTVFPGAEMVYDLESKVSCRAPRTETADTISDDDEEDAVSSNSSSKMLARTTSADNLVNEASDDDDISKSESCPPYLEYDGSSKIGAIDFRKACIELSRNFN